MVTQKLILLGYIYILKKLEKIFFEIIIHCMPDYGIPSLTCPLLCRNCAQQNGGWEWPFLNHCRRFLFVTRHNRMDQILPEDIIIEFNCQSGTLMKNVKPIYFLQQSSLKHPSVWQRDYDMAAWSPWYFMSFQSNGRCTWKISPPHVHVKWKTKDKCQTINFNALWTSGDI